MTEYAELKNSAYKKRQALLKGDNANNLSDIGIYPA